MEIQDFFEPVNLDGFAEEGRYDEATWFHAIDVNQGEARDISEKKIALIGISGPNGEEKTAAAIRKYLYGLKRAEYAEEIIDLGNFSFNYAPKTYESLGFVLSELMTANIIPVILNGSQEVTFAQYLAFSYLKQYANLVTFDARFDFNMREGEPMNADNFLQRILMAEPSYLFGYTDIGFQSHFTDSTIQDFMEKLHFDLYRLGDARANMPDLEPVLRSAHFASWDLSAIRQSDAPGTTSPSPNGFYGEEACLLSRYAGLGNAMRSAGFYNMDLSRDRDGQTAHLCAQMIWYFVDGYLNRYPESPSESSDEFLKFITSLQNNAYQIVFYKSTRTDRWWMEVPIGDREFEGSNYIMPCSYSDYLAATREEIPERWMAAMKKLS